MIRIAAVLFAAIVSDVPALADAVDQLSQGLEQHRHDLIALRPAGDCRRYRLHAQNL